MGPEMVETPYDVRESRRKQYVKELEIKFYNKLHRKKKCKNRRKK